MKKILSAVLVISILLAVWTYNKPMPDISDDEFGQRVAVAFVNMPTLKSVKANNDFRLVSEILNPALLLLPESVRDISETIALIPLWSYQYIIGTIEAIKFIFLAKEGAVEYEGWVRSYKRVLEETNTLGDGITVGGRVYHWWTAGNVIDRKYEDAQIFDGYRYTYRYEDGKVRIAGIIRGETE